MRCISVTLLFFRVSQGQRDRIMKDLLGWYRRGNETLAGVERGTEVVSLAPLRAAPIKQFNLCEFILR